MYGSNADRTTDLHDKYIVWSPGSTQPVTKTYDNRQVAIKVAYKLAAKFPGEQFAVCKVVGSARANSVAFDSFEE